MQKRRRGWVDLAANSSAAAPRQRINPPPPVQTHILTQYRYTQRGEEKGVVASDFLLLRPSLWLGYEICKPEFHAKRLWTEDVTGGKALPRLCSHWLFLLQRNRLQHSRPWAQRTFVQPVGRLRSLPPLPTPKHGRGGGKEMKQLLRDTERGAGGGACSRLTSFYVGNSSPEMFLGDQLAYNDQQIKFAVEEAMRQAGRGGDGIGEATRRLRLRLQHHRRHPGKPLSVSSSLFSLQAAPRRGGKRKAFSSQRRLPRQWGEKSRAPKGTTTLQAAGRVREGGEAAALLYRDGAGLGPGEAEEGTRRSHARCRRRRFASIHRTQLMSSAANHSHRCLRKQKGRVVWTMPRKAERRRRACVGPTPPAPRAQQKGGLLTHAEGLFCTRTHIQTMRISIRARGRGGGEIGSFFLANWN